jgi:hypothetical protein
MSLLLAGQGAAPSQTATAKYLMHLGSGASAARWQKHCFVRRTHKRANGSAIWSAAAFLA